MQVHPKVAASTIAGLGWTAICLALQQYDPSIAPNAPLTAGVGTFLSAIVGYFFPSNETTG